MKDFKAGIYIDQGYYKSFLPYHINRVWNFDDMSLISMLSKADRMLGRLDMFSNHIPNIDLFIQMHIRKEALQSTRIEGTQTKMEEAMMDEEDVPLDKRDDWSEVQNYITAMNVAIKRLETLPLSSRLIKEIHSILMKGVRGEHKQPGEFRLSQNWIGGNNINDAIFIPPAFSEIPDLMSDIEKFVHEPKCQMPDLIKIAIIHYQFETIHPFNDGNGRTGRLLITLYLVSTGILKRPVLYLSDYLENHRNSYYEMIMKARTENRIDDWIRFFLKGVIETANKSVETFEKILDLEEEYEQLAQKMGSRSANTMKLLNVLYENPITDARKVARLLGISLQSAYSLIGDMEKRGFLFEFTHSKRGKKYMLYKYLRLFMQ